MRCGVHIYIRADKDIPCYSSSPMCDGETSLVLISEPIRPNEEGDSNASDLVQSLNPPV